jgi:hypothetical protein
MPPDNLSASLGAVPNFVFSVLFPLYLLASVYIYVSLVRQISVRRSTSPNGSTRTFGLPEAVLAAALIFLLLLNISASLSNRSVQLIARNLLQILLFTVALVLFVAVSCAFADWT